MTAAYYTHAISCDPTCQEAYVEKAFALMSLGKLKLAKEELYKVLEVNQSNKQALDLLSTINDRLSTGSDTIGVGKVELSLKRKPGNYPDNFMLDP